MAQNPTSTWSETGTGTNDGATAIHAASTIGAANRTYFVTNISGHTDMDSIVQVLDGTTVKWETAVAVAAATCPEAWELVSRSVNKSTGAFSCAPKKPAKPINCGPGLAYFEKGGVIGCRKGK